MKSREDWLCDQLDRDDLTEALRAKYEAELDDFANRFTSAQSKAKTKAIADQARLEELKAKILANDVDFIKSFGEEEFGQDYDVVEEGNDFVVYSKVAKDNQEHRRVHPTLEAANADLCYLFYNRLYDRYIRPGELSSLGELAS
jgi:hypothetical protein